MRTEAHLVELTVDLVKVLDALLLMAEDLDDLLAVHRLLGEALHRADGLLLLHEVLGGTAADDLADIEHCHDAEQKHQRHPDAVIDHDGKHRDHDRAGADKGRERAAHELAHGIDIVGIEGHDVPVLVGVEIPDGKILHSVEHLAAHLVEEALGHDGHELGLERERADGDGI